MSEVVDLAGHKEIVAWRAAKVTTAMAVFKNGNDGVECPVKEEPIALQFAGLEYKLEVQRSPYADFGIFRPSGAFPVSFA